MLFNRDFRCPECGTVFRLAVDQYGFARNATDGGEWPKKGLNYLCGVCAGTESAEKEWNKMLDGAPAEEPKPAYKYDEEKNFTEILDYIKSTYKGHYVGHEDEEDVQTLDLIAANGHAEGFCAGNAVKYVSRYGKKAGYNREDIFKAIHYCLLLLHFTKNKK